MKLFTAPKASHRSWTDHFVYLTAVSDACDGADSLVLNNIVHYADPHMRMTMFSRLYIHWTDPLRQDEELAQFAQSREVNTHAKNLGQDVYNAVESRKEPKDKVKAKAKSTFTEGDERTCYKCGEVGHIRSRCPHSKKKSTRNDFTFAIGNDGGLEDDH
uniref:CCHC-type domain-containing protein n=1 Tax=Peronospora matthiolae TaxID=2874970 RepID=A0AAV1TZR9_9STRA